ncbi:MAG: class I SAM-dependent methyltransferase [Eubacteriales bacterium]|nr:class I SAM-dependent methyltransferase [Eubacteriales bacterium]
MAAYSEFASVYDMFMDDIPYETWLANVTKILQECGICEGLVLELGCGTGTFTELLAQAGYDMIGVDNSEEMLAEAMRKRAQSGADILYLQQDMRSFELYGTVRAIVSVCDSMNYIGTEEELQEVFELANNYLDPGGIFLFDLKTAHYFREVMGDATFAENREEGSFIWENAWYEEEQINEYDLTLFVKQPSGLYEKSEETHLQRAYDTETVIRLLEAAGMEFVAAYDVQTGAAVTDETERIYILARECGKQSQ